MLIASKFKRPNAPIDIEGTQYFFRPIDPANTDSPHVCEVANLQHVQRFLGITEGYYIYDSASGGAPAGPAGPAAQRPVPTPPTPPATPGQPEPAGNGVIEGDGPAPATPKPSVTASTPEPTTATDDAASGDDAEEIAGQAAKVIEGHWQKVLSLVKGGDIPRAVLQEALRQEQAKAGEDEPRPSVVKALQAALAT